MQESDLSLLIEAARRASKIALPLAAGVAKCWEKGDDAGPVTEADIAVNQMLIAFLRSERPDYGWLSEESEDDLSRLEKQVCFIIDPIDGTRSFVKGDKTWAHSFAVTENGIPSVAVVYLPALSFLYVARIGKGAFLNSKPISVSSQTVLESANVLAANISKQPRYWKNASIPDFSRHHRPSLAYRLALVAEGRFDAMITFRNTWEWDICAGALIATEAGAVVSDRSGKLLTFNDTVPIKEGIIAAGRPLHKDILSRSNSH